MTHDMNSTAGAAGVFAHACERTESLLTRARTLTGVLLLLLLSVLMVVAVSPLAHAEDKPQDYSLYHLASNASTYFSTSISPEKNGKGVDQQSWGPIVNSPATAGSLLGYADTDSGSLKWLFSAISGSSQTIKYDALDSAHAPGMKDYAHFGAANQDLGLDKMYSSAGFDGMIQALGGSLIWLAYAMAMGVSMMFWAFIQLLKLLNPFMWFGKAVSAVNPTFGEGMTDGGNTTLTDDSGPLAGLVNWISTWYGTLNSLSWDVFVPLFIGFLLLGLVFFKKMDRGSALKRLIVRVVFIGVGLPLIGSMYTGVLDKFDAGLFTQSAGPTKAVLSTYVDFNTWMMQDRLQVPANASITWDAATGHAQPTSVFSVRNTALAINEQTGKYPGITSGSRTTDASTTWANTDPGVQKGNDDSNAVFATFDLLGRYISGKTVNPSDFESNIQGSVTAIPDVTDKKQWFAVGGNDYSDPADTKFDNPTPTPGSNPILSVKGTIGLTATTDDKGTVFTSAGVDKACGFRVVVGNSGTSPAACNLAPLAAYNYLNTQFDTGSMTIYSSNKATSGFTRSFHASVSQVGAGPAGFMYWANAMVLLSAIALVGMFYGIGLVTGSLKRTFGTVAALPFATVGVMPGIAKVVIYATAMILEILVTLFMYQFVSEVLTSLPQIIEGPISALVSDKTSIFNSPDLGAIAVVVMTFVSILLVIGAAVVMLKSRTAVLKALDEAVTKLVDKFLDTNTPPRMGSGGGLLPAVAGGLGTAAGMAAGKRLGGSIGGKSTPGGFKEGPDGSRGSNQSTNAGGLYRNPQLEGSTPGELGPGGGGLVPTGGPGNGPGSPGGGWGTERLDGTGGDGPKGLPSGPADSGSGMGATAAGHGIQRSRSNRELAQQVMQQGGLSRPGIAAGSKNGSGGAGRDQSPGNQNRNLGATNGGPGNGSNRRARAAGIGSNGASKALPQNANRGRRALASTQPNKPRIPEEQEANQDPASARRLKALPVRPTGFSQPVRVQSKQSTSGRTRVGKSN
ncbi:MULTISPECIES: hypothetical protein [Arthrobacter]|uniref:Uncharacterized protein n=1 Tax=Arthrobacter terricola TaxID=2547396 RepID=A0A4R5K5P9_9MICC|nr:MULTISPECIES: hypothetical protein [Arthrobacter]MBT8163584.1 hypothetical protein [Arthrobacter sp. GN70]TDF88579.1 hypothetical protein E1809_23685 [Arthrobacter terricola]